jgi:hypothetical protein
MTARVAPAAEYGVAVGKPRRPYVDVRDQMSRRWNASPARPRMSATHSPAHPR